MASETQPDWACLVDKHAERVFRIAYRILGSVQDAEDVSQNVFSEAVKLHAAGPIQSWLGLFVRLASLRALDMRRSRRSVLQLIESDRATQSGPAEEAIGAELAVWLREATSRLPDQQAAVFSLTYYEHLDRGTIAEVLEIEPEAVSTCLYKARKRLRSELQVLDGGTE
ncbi:RNA polymerase sigma factor [Bythopirellula goksoeyrii]|uniref:ECF RNA polymerase sigma factor SigE n=1 Tax=Bythopirellula goksoeyrii TaxID=1400387 RepID=A0A5B9QK90_9BACT|nr:sigma-70 family RNA polymerase sigma factor [Bythopirellula goksoeyrii]QEG34571.1 ECF RNA polymerase sigma factor SigE [Bythopirellula goksoeyrii]